MTITKATTFKQYLEIANAGSTFTWGGIPVVNQCCEDLFSYLGTALTEIGDQQVYAQIVQWASPEISRAMSWSSLVGRGYAAEYNPRFLELNVDVQQALQALCALFDVVAP